MTDTAGITLQPYDRLIQVRLTRLAGSVAPLVTLPGQALLQTVDKAILDDVVIDGRTRSAATVGVAVGNHAAASLRDVRVAHEGTGFQLAATQFCDFCSVKAYDCGVGFDLRNTATEGGGNSNLFLSPQAIGNDVGMVIQNVLPDRWPMHSIELVSPQLLHNALCGLAVFDVQDLNIRGFANEANGEGVPDSGTYAGRLVKRSSVFLSGASVTVDGGHVSEAIVSPAFRLERGSRLTLRDLTGYGNTTGALVAADASSDVVLQGRWGCVGTVHGVTRATVSITSPRGAIVAATSQPPTADATRVTFAPTLGTGEQNRMVRQRVPFGAATMLAVTLTTSADTTLRLEQYPHAGRAEVSLLAGETRRVFWWSTGTVPGLQPFIAYPIDSAGATVTFDRWEAVGGDDGRNLRGQWSALVSNLS